MKALLIQIEHEIKRYDISKSNPIDTLFIGGGTPSAIEARLYEHIFDTLREYFVDDIEITTEANPNSATKEWLSDMYSMGVNRVSFGVQSFDDTKLKLLGRNHTKDIAIKAIENATKIYKNISTDIIYNVKDDTMSLLKTDIDQALSFGINHISSYSLTLEANTKFANSDMAIDDENISRKMIEYISSYLPQYEISNFGTYQSRHNLGYWQYYDYVGVGAGAVGFRRDSRYYPTSDVSTYISNPTNISIENLSRDDIVLEKLFLGFRSCVGVDMDILNSRQKEIVNILLDESKLYQKDNRVYNSDYLLADEVALYIYE
jgi:oxygen-independent coproporphyrinogen-3 oxidase